MNSSREIILKRLSAENLPKCLRSNYGNWERVEDGGGDALASRDGGSLYFSKGDAEPGHSRLSLNGSGKEEVVVPGVWCRRGFSIGARGVYFDSLAERKLQFLDFETGAIRVLFDESGPFGHYELTVSPDEKWILFGRQQFSESELMLAENFR